MTDKGKLFFEMLGNLLPEEVESLKDALNKKSATSIRINPFKKYTNPHPHEKVPWARQGYFLHERPSFTLDPNFHAGAYYVQEASSMFLGYLIEFVTDKLDNPLVLDLCAAPGGKSTNILSSLNNKGLLIANEVILSRAKVLNQNLVKWGNANFIVSNNDPSFFENINLDFDIILLDAPCSGEGLIRKNRQVLNQWSLENVKFCSARQKRITANIITSLKKEGILIYSTCTYNEIENIDNCIWMRDEFELESIDIPIDSTWGISKIERNGVHAYQFFPHKVKGEGYFISAFRKKNPASRSKSLKNTKKLEKLSKKKIDVIKPWLDKPEEYNFYMDFHNNIYAIPIDLNAPFLNASALNFIGYGLNVGKLKGDVFIPSHSLALSMAISNEITSIELDLPTALKYLKGDAIKIETHAKGWQLVSYCGNNLGWIKSLEKRVNNYYPKELRIRMSLDT